MQSFTKGETVKKSNIFTYEEMMTFLKEAKDEDCYWFVRKIVLVLALLGGNRLAEIRKISWSSVQSHPHGFLVQMKSDR